MSYGGVRSSIPENVIPLSPDNVKEKEIKIEEDDDDEEEEDEVRFLS